MEERITTTPSACRSCAAHESGICAQLSATTLTRLRAQARTVAYPADRGLWSEDSHAPFVGILRSGVLRMARYSAEGRRQIMVMVSPGELVGEGVEKRAGYELEAVTPVELCRIEPLAFERLMDQAPELRRTVYRQHSDRLEALRELAWSLGMQTPDERVARFLVLASQWMPYEPLRDGSGILTVTIPRADIADLLGTTRESISRITHRLQAEGLIEIRDPAHFRIPDMDLLRQAGGLDLRSSEVLPGARGVENKLCSNSAAHVI